MVVAGQIPASVQSEGAAKAVSEHGIPTFAELGAHVYKSDGGKFIGEGTDAMPVTEKDQVIRIDLSKAQRPWLIPVLEKKGGTGEALVTADGKPYGDGGLYFLDYKGSMMKKRCIVLKTSSDPETNLALCVEDRALNTPLSKKDFHIYGFKPRFEGDAAVKVDGYEGEEPLYPLAQVEDKEGHPYVHRIRMWTSAKKYELTYIGQPKHIQTRMNEGVLVRPANDDKKGVANLHRMKLSTLDNNIDDTGWEMTIAPGIDPLLMACLAAIFEHTQARSPLQM